MRLKPFSELPCGSNDGNGTFVSFVMKTMMVANITANMTLCISGDNKLREFILFLTDITLTYLMIIKIYVVISK